MKTEDLLKLKKKMENHLSNYEKANKELINSCTHPEEYVEDRSQYYDGGYDYTAHTDYWKVCTICGKRGEVTSKDHGYYG